MKTFPGIAAAITAAWMLAGCGPELDLMDTEEPLGASEDELGAPGCRGKVSDYAERWTQWDWYGGFPHAVVPVRMTGELVYQYCPNGSLPAKVKPKRIRWCWDQLSNEHHFRGVSFNARITDTSGRVDNPTAFLVRDNGKLRRCLTQDIQLKRESWHFLSRKPKWYVHTKILVNDWFDPDANWKTKTGSSYHLLNPSRDVRLSGPY